MSGHFRDSYCSLEGPCLRYCVFQVGIGMGSVMCILFIMLLTLGFNAITKLYVMHGLEFDVGNVYITTFSCCYVLSESERFNTA